MKLIVTPGPDGLISNGRAIRGQPLPEGLIAIEHEGKTLIGRYLTETECLFETARTQLDPHENLHVLGDGTIESRFDYRGSGPWFDQNASTADRTVKHEIAEIGIVPPNDFGHPVTQGWANMAMTPRPETTAEKKAREKAAVEAAAAKEVERRANRVLSAVQIRLAASQLGIREAIETLVADPDTPRVIRDYWEYSTEYRRSSPIWAQALTLMGATEAQLDQLYDLGETL